MSQSGILLRFCHKVLVWVLIVGITADFVVCKTVTRQPAESTEPCTGGENCGHPEHQLDHGQPAMEPVHQMQQQKETEEAVTAEPAGINIDPDSLLHPVGGSHVHDGAPPVDAEVQDFGAAAPDVAKELHGGVDLDPGSAEVPNLEDNGPHMDAMLHGGLKHVHSLKATDNLTKSVEHEGVIGVDPEEMLHDGADAHSHGGSDRKERQNSEGNFGLGTDIEGILHGGDQHVHSPDRKPEQESDAVPEVPIGASDPEAFMHDGDGHVHAQGGAAERSDSEPRPYGAADPDQILHGSDEKHAHTVRQAIDGSRPLSGAKDPDVAGMDVNPVDIRIGTLQPEDTADYHKWKSEKEKQTENPSRTSGWLSGFSYIKDAVLRDLEVVRKRYLGGIFGDETEEEGSTSEGAPNRRHDEA